MTTRNVADELGVSTGFVIGEILDGRLRAVVLGRPGKRRVYRISQAELAAYRRKFGWGVGNNTTDASNAPGSPQTAEKPNR